MTTTTVSFKVFVIKPVLEMQEGVQPGHPQRCTKGHRWNIGGDFVGIEIDLTSFGMTEGSERYCFLCLRDALRRHVGRVEDV